MARALVLTVALEVVAAYLNTDRGVPWMFGLFVVLVILLDDALKRTQWGRSMTAIGGNREAARRIDLSSSLRYMITGGVLAIAVIVDSLARRSRVSHGRA